MVRQILEKSTALASISQSLFLGAHVGPLRQARMAKGPTVRGNPVDRVKLVSNYLPVPTGGPYDYVQAKL